jgi:hypothetical protein
MNIFFLHQDPTVAASMVCDQHQKMILESAQLMSTAHHELGSSFAGSLYKSTHRNHPSAVWARTSIENYEWLYEHFLALGYEMKFRRNGEGELHASILKLGKLLRRPPKNLHAKDLTVPSVVCNDKFRLFKKPSCWAQTVRGYRHYYTADKDFATYLNREPPEWLIESRAEIGSLPSKILLKSSNERYVFSEYTKPLPLSHLLSGIRSLTNPYYHDLKTPSSH